MVKAVLWDLGGVLLRTTDHSPRDHWAEILGIRREHLSQQVFTSEVAEAAYRGQATLEDLWAHLQERFKLTDSQRDRLEREFWAGDELDEELIEWIGSLRPRYKTGLVSNAFSDIREALEQTWGIAEVFDTIILSSEVGMVKPDPAIYQEALERLEIQPEEALFIDDFIENIRGARRVGMKAIHFTDPARIREQVQDFLDPSG